MFNSLTGPVTSKNSEGITLQTGGIEWSIQMPLLSIAHFHTDGTEQRVFIYLLHREDRMNLFGFASVTERNAFLELIKVNGIGPKQAIKILSAVKVDEFSAILESGSIEQLIRIPGLGKATAQKILLALKGKLRLDVDETDQSSDDDVVISLTAMGFERKAAAAAVKRLKAGLQNSELDEASLEKELLRRAIIELST